MLPQPPLALTTQELSRAFADPRWAERYPPILSIEQAADLLQLPVETLRGWRSRGLLNSCSRRVGKRVRLFRDRLVTWYFNDAGSVGQR